MQQDLPFSGLKIVDLSQGIAGPYCTQILWQQGAEVIKIEPFEGDWGRHVGTVKNGHSALSISYNAGKKSVAIDAKKPEGQKLIKQLVTDADILIQNFRPGVVERLGLDFDSLQTNNPTLIYVSISGYGNQGAYAKAPASDSVMQADSGLMFTNRTENDQPQRIGMLLADIATALYAAQLTTTALYQRLKLNQGAHIELNMLEACTALQINDIASAAIGGIQPKGAVSAPNGVFYCADEPITVLALNNHQFERLCKAINKEQWLQDQRFSTNELRMQHKEYLHAELSKILRSQTQKTWLEKLKQHEVLHAPVRDYAALLEHPQAQELGIFQQFSQPHVGLLALPGIPGQATQRRPLKAAPRIGEHTQEILSAYGLSASEFEDLVQNQVIHQAHLTKEP